MSLRNVLILSVILCVVTFVTTRYYFPQVETRTEVVEKEVVRTDVRTIIKEVVKADGTKEKTTEIIDKTKRTDESKKTDVKLAKKDWHVSVLYTRNVSENQAGYTLNVSRRQLGPWFLTGSMGRIGNDTNLGIGIGMEF